MKIHTVKLHSSGYLVNNSILVLSKEGKYGEQIQKWLNTHTPTPEFTQTELSNLARKAVNKDARTYLNNTDWYVIRAIEGVVMPPEIEQARAEARLQVID